MILENRSITLVLMKCPMFEIERRYRPAFPNSGLSEGQTP